MIQLLESLPLFLCSLLDTSVPEVDDVRDNVGR